MITIKDDKYLDCDEISELLGICKGTILNWVSADKIPSIKLGKKRIFHLDTINDWLQSNINQS